MHKITENQKKQFVVQYEEGKRVTEICFENCIARSTMYHWINEYKKTPTRGKKLITGRQVYLLEQKVHKLSVENEILKQCDCCINSPPIKKSTAIEKIYNKYSVHALCSALEIRRSTLYHFKNRKPNKTKIELFDETLRPIIASLFHESKSRFGSRMIKVKINELGYVVSPKRIQRLMNEMNLVCNGSKTALPEYKRIYKYYGSSDTWNKLNRNFNINMPNKVWVSDISYLRTLEGIYYICIIIDLYSRKVINYKLSDNMNTQLVIETLSESYNLRKQPINLIFHSDQGSQYISNDLKSYLKKNKIEQSLSEPGHPHDNAVSESFFASLKKEELYQYIIPNKEELSYHVDDYISYFNNVRPHQKLSMKTPSEKEQEYYAK